MSRLARRAVIATKGGGGGKTYAEFVTHITGLATGGVASWSSINAEVGSYRTTAAGAAGQMYGSSWASFFLSDVAPCRLIQHGLPSAAAFNAQVAGGFQIFFRLAGAGDQTTFSAVNRNGYLSQAFTDGTPYPGFACDLILYWDGTQAQKMNPSTGTGPTPYTW